MIPMIKSTDIGELSEQIQKLVEIRKDEAKRAALQAVTHVPRDQCREILEMLNVWDSLREEKNANR